MKSCIALFRGINVGGSHPLPMKDLKLLFEQNGCLDVRTYIQSGNITFRSSMSDCKPPGKPDHRHCFAKSWLRATRGLHLFFLAERPRKPDLKACEAIKRKTERFQLKGSILQT
jgi:Protein of unknown function (DUF1697)